MGKPKKHMSFTATNYVPTDDQSPDSSNLRNHANGTKNSTSSLDQLINSGTFIDHRKSFDWANAHSSPTNRRRKKSNGSFRNQKSNKDPPSLPLTNRNLQTLIRRSSTIEDPISPTAVAIDIDKFTNEQRLFAKSNTWQDHYEDRDDEQYSYSEFGESNPSSEH